MRCSRILACSLLLTISLPSHADLADELDTMFDSLVNVTDPTAHLGSVAACSPAARWSRATG